VLHHICEGGVDSEMQSYDQNVRIECSMHTTGIHYQLAEPSNFGSQMSSLESYSVGSVFQCLEASQHLSSLLLSSYSR
jgi:hypothetical protein